MTTTLKSFVLTGTGDPMGFLVLSNGSFTYTLGQMKENESENERNREKPPQYNPRHIESQVDESVVKKHLHLHKCQYSD